MTNVEYKNAIRHMAKMMGKEWTPDVEEQTDLWFPSLKRYAVESFQGGCRKIAEHEEFFPKTPALFLRFLKDAVMPSYAEQTAGRDPCSDCLSMGFVKLQGRLERRDGQYRLNRDMANGGSLDEFLVRCDCAFGDARKAAWPRMPTFAKLFGDVPKPGYAENSPETIRQVRTVVQRWMRKFPRDSQEYALQRTRSLLHAREEECLGHQREDDDLPF